MAAADPLLVAGWLAGRSIARGLPLPVPDGGGWRVDTGSALERRRYVFAGVTDGLKRLAETIDETHVPLKLCADFGTMCPLLPARWAFASLSYLMIRHEHRLERATLPSGYRADVREGPVRFATIRAADGVVAASGRAALWQGFHVFDQIVTHEAHRRRGLGRTIMALLADHAPARASQSVLVATDAGRALYETIGWAIHAPYTTAVIEAR